MVKITWFVVAGVMALVLGYGAIHDCARISSQRESKRMHDIEMKILVGMEIRVEKYTDKVMQQSIEIKELLLEAEQIDIKIKEILAINN